MARWPLLRIGDAIDNAMDELRATARDDHRLRSPAAMEQAGVAVIRISGPAAGRRLAPPLPGRCRRRVPPPCARLRDPAAGRRARPRPRAVVPRPRKLDRRGHGRAAGSWRPRRDAGRARCARRPSTGCRPAEPGEFARRAFENGKLDLTESRARRPDRCRDRRRSGARPCARPRARCGRLYDGLAGAADRGHGADGGRLDFSDEADVASEASAGPAPQAEALQAEIVRHLDDGHRGESSATASAWSRRPAQCGQVEPAQRARPARRGDRLGGGRHHARRHRGAARSRRLPIILSDTAGIREAAGKVEQEGIRRALARAGDADLVLWLHDATAPPSVSPSIDGAARLIEAINKIDLAPAPSDAALPLSVKSGEGLDRLIARLTEEVRQAADVGENPAITRARHRRELERCAAALARFLASDFAALELRAEDLRDAATALGRLTGRVDVEDISTGFSRISV